jgi:hypothetical protein
MSNEQDDEMMYIQTRKYDRDTGEYHEGEKISVTEVGRYMTVENLAEMLDVFVNNMSRRPTVDGYELGVALCRKHRFLQSQIINMLLQCLRELGLQEYTDARNEAMVNWAREATDMIKQREFKRNGLFFLADDKRVPAA